MRPLARAFACLTRARVMQWGLVATVKAEADTVLGFVAHHLDLGAHRVFIYLDAPDAALAQQLRSHPKVRAIETNSVWWTRRGGHPAKHQHRQQHNAQHAYEKAQDLDWLAHIDVDEFLCPKRPISELLTDVPPHITTARVPPIEALVGAPGYFKALPDTPDQRREVPKRLYPDYGARLPGGFVSHIVGKTFVRTGLSDTQIRIHGIKQNKQLNPNEHSLRDIDLAHFHATNWETWRSAFEYRFTKGAYRPELPGPLGQSRHAFFAALLSEGGEHALRRFFDQVMTGNPAHLQALEGEGLLRYHPLDLAHSRERHFAAATRRSAAN